MSQKNNKHFMKYNNNDKMKIRVLRMTKICGRTAGIRIRSLFDMKYNVQGSPNCFLSASPSATSNMVKPKQKP